MKTKLLFLAVIASAFTFSATKSYAQQEWSPYVTGLKVTNLTPNSATLNWDDVLDKTKGDFFIYSFSGVSGVFNQTQTSKVYTNLLANTDYCFDVRVERNKFWGSLAKICFKTESYHCVANINGTFKICDGNCSTSQPFSTCAMQTLTGTVYTADKKPVNSSMGTIIKPGQCMLYQTGAVKNATEAHPGVAY